MDKIDKCLDNATYFKGDGCFWIDLQKLMKDSYIKISLEDSKPERPYVVILPINVSLLILKRICKQAYLI